MFILNILKMIIKGFYFHCSLLAKGFYFYPKQIFILCKKIFKTNKFDQMVKYYQRRQQQPEFCLLIILYFVAVFSLIRITYVEPQKVVKNDIKVEINENIDNEDYILDSSKDVEEENNDQIIENDNSDSIAIDTNPYRNFAKIPLNSVNFDELRRANSDVVLWISVDGTNINYPIVQTVDNDYYLNHSFDKSYKKSGWTYIDYRNNKDMSDYNTIFYGHNLLNKTSFGTISNIFTDEWAKTSNHTIVILDDYMQYVYKVFSAYYVEPEIYYLQNVFYSDSEYQSFLNTLSARSIINIDNSVDINDKIITLSTCTDDNKGRKVVHAKLIFVGKRS